MNWVNIDDQFFEIKELKLKINNDHQGLITINIDSSKNLNYLNFFKNKWLQQSNGYNKFKKDNVMRIFSNTHIFENSQIITLSFENEILIIELITDSVRKIGKAQLREYNINLILS